MPDGGCALYYWLPPVYPTKGPGDTGAGMRGAPPRQASAGDLPPRAPGQTSKAGGVSAQDMQGCHGTGGFCKQELGVGGAEDGDAASPSTHALEDAAPGGMRELFYLLRTVEWRGYVFAQDDVATC